MLVRQSSEQGTGGLVGFYTSRGNNNQNLIIISSSFEHFLQFIHGMQGFKCRAGPLLSNLSYLTHLFI